MWSFQDNEQRTKLADYFFQKVQVNNLNVMIDRRNFFDKTIKKIKKINKIVTVQGDDSTNGSLLDYTYFKWDSKLIEINLSETLDADPKAKQQINITLYLDRAGNTLIFSLLKIWKRHFLDFLHGSVRVLLIYFGLI